MKIKESVIEEIIAFYEDNQDEYLEDLQELITNYPAIGGYLLQESNDILEEEEKDILWYIALIIMKSIERGGYMLDGFSEKVFIAAEEQNWDTYQLQKTGDFQERLNAFFEGYPEEDLLAFVEDMVQLDEDSPMTKIGREVIFISIKSIIDQL